MLSRKEVILPISIYGGCCFTVALEGSKFITTFFGSRLRCLSRAGMIR
jgi:hypothetical protein